MNTYEKMDMWGGDESMSINFYIIWAVILVVTHADITQNFVKLF